MLHSEDLAHHSEQPHPSPLPPNPPQTLPTQRRRYSHTEPDATSADSPPAGGLDVSGAGVLRVAAARPGVRSTQHGEPEEHLAAAAHTVEPGLAAVESALARRRRQWAAAAAAEAHPLEAALGLVEEGHAAAIAALLAVRAALAVVVGVVIGHRHRHRGLGLRRAFVFGVGAAAAGEPAGGLWAEGSAPDAAGSAA